MAISSQSVIHRREDGVRLCSSSAACNFGASHGVRWRGDCCATRGDASEPWMDLHAPGAMACLLVSGRRSDGLMSEIQPLV